VAKKIRVGIIGGGGIARMAHIPGYQAAPDCEVVAVCDVKKQVAVETAQKFNIPRVYTRYQDMLRKEQLDAVSVCTPNFMHCKPTVDALKAGLHVLCEKPLAMNATEAKLMVDTAKKHKRQIQVGHHMRFDGANVALKRFFLDGAMGKIYYARVQALRRAGIPSWGVFGQKKLQGGGPLIDIGVHILDLTMHLLGFPRPIAVSGMTYQMFGRDPSRFNQWGPWDTKTFTVEDFAAAFVRFQGGLTMTIESSFMANIEQDVFNTTFVGDKGGCQISPPKIFRQESGTLVDVTPTRLPQTKPYIEEVVSFVHSIRNNKPVAIPGWQGLMVMQILDAIYKSAQAGHEVRIA
jgi:predicted dehydrogenase